MLDRLQGLPLPAEVWEQTVLPARVPGYQPRWLDEWIAGGAGVWVGQGDGSGAGCWRSSAARRCGSCRRPTGRTCRRWARTPLRVLERLRQRGASFLTDLAADTGLSPSVVPRRPVGRWRGAAW